MPRSSPSSFTALAVSPDRPSQQAFKEPETSGGAASYSSSIPRRPDHTLIYAVAMAVLPMSGSKIFSWILAFAARLTGSSPRRTLRASAVLNLVRTRKRMCLGGDGTRKQARTRTTAVRTCRARDQGCFSQCAQHLRLYGEWDLPDTSHSRILGPKWVYTASGSGDRARR